MSNRKRANKAEKLRNGSLTATLYQAKKAVAGRSYEIFRLVYVEPGGRRRVRDFGTRQKAKEVWAEVAHAYALGRPDALSFEPSERQEFESSVKLLEGTGVSVYHAVSAFVESQKGPKFEPRKVAEVVAELVKDAESRKLSAEHVSDMRKRLARFSGSFQCQISSVTPSQVLQWLRALKSTDGKALSNRTKFNFQRLVATLFRFAARMRYIPRTLADDIAELDKPKPEPASAEIFTPAELRQILDALSEDSIPAFVVGAFAGLRSAELARLEWADIRLDQRVIILGAHQAKTASRRVVPIAENLGQWLAGHEPKSGRICPVATPGWMSQRFSDAAAQAGVAWRRNGLRHSFISYRFALCPDAARVATECGNSPAMIHKHYKALVLEAEAKAWFDIRPTTAANVIPMLTEATR